MMDVSDVLCNICLGILVEPVTMPCKHRICKVCFDRSLEHNSLTCPLCKTRINVWCRRNPKALVDKELWQKIQEKFPERVSLRLQGVEGDAEDLEELFPIVPCHQHVPEGEIGADFRKEMSQFQREEEEREQRRRVEEEGEEAGVIGEGEEEEEVVEGGVTQEMLQEQLEAFRRIEQEKQDEALARVLSRESERVEATPMTTRAKTPQGKASGARPKSSPVIKNHDGKKMRQMSLDESFKPGPK